MQTKLHRIGMLISILVLTVSYSLADTWSLSGSDFNTKSYAANDGDHTKSEITYTTSNVMKSSSNIQFKKSGSTLYNKTAMPGNITKITASTNLTITVGTTSNPTSGTTVTSGNTISGSYTYFLIKNSTSSAVAVSTITIEYEGAPAVAYTVTFTKTDGTTTDEKESSVGAGVTPPTMDSPCDGFTFQGWCKGSYSNSATSETELTTVTLTGGKYYPTADNEQLYPVYTKTESSGGTTSSSETITLNSGTFTTDHIDWGGTSCAITQTKGSSSTAVSSSYVSAPRVYKGHILSFVANSSYKITKIEITVSGTYYGNSMTAGTAISNNTVTDNTTDVGRTWTTTSGGTHTITSTSDDGLSAIYIQNVASTNVQLRPTAIKVYYKTSGGSTTYYYSYPTCCTPLGTINGSVNVTQNTATVTWDKVTGATDWSVGCKVTSDEKAAGTVGTPTLSNNKYTCEITGLSASVGYTITLTPTVETGYCDTPIELTATTKAEQVTITWDNNGTSTTTQVDKGSKPTPPSDFTACDSESTTLYGWATAAWDGKATDLNDTKLTGIYIYTATTLPEAKAKATYYAVWAKTESAGSGDYELVSSAPDDWSGTYLIVSGTSCFNGSLTTLDAAGNYQSVTISSNKIASSSTTDTYSVVISKSAIDGKYYIKTSSGYYIGSTAASGADNELLSNATTTYDNSISISSNSVTITGTDHTLKYYAQSGQTPRFRYYKSTSTNVTLPYLYKKTSTTTYSNYLTTCCANAELAFGATDYEVVTNTDNTAIFTISSKSSATISYSITPTSELTVDSDNKKFTAAKAGVYTVTASQAAATENGTTYCAAEATTTVTVKTKDFFVDNIHSTADQEGVDTGSGYTVPKCDDVTKETTGDCATVHYKFMGWIEESKAKGAINEGDLDFKGGETGVPATGKTYYAVWGRLAE